MQDRLLTPDRLEELLERFSSCRIAVLGDFFLDRYLDIDPGLEEVSVETGKPAHQISAVRCAPGAAGTVVSNLASLRCGALQAIGFTGDDGEAYELRRSLQQLGCSTEHLHAVPERATPTYTKPRDITVPGLAGEHSRLDRKNRAELPENVEVALVDSLRTVVSGVDAVIVLDQVESRNCGVVTNGLREVIAEVAADHPDVVFWADSRRRIGEFRGVLTKPNQFELIGRDEPEVGESVDPARLHAAAMAHRSRTGAPVFVTCGGEGMALTDPAWLRVRGFRVDGETDVTGAGDSASAGCVLSLCAGGSLVESAVVGNLVASITIEQLATTGTANQDQLRRRVAEWLDQG